MLRRTFPRGNSLRGAARLALSFTVGNHYDGFTFIGSRTFQELNIQSLEFVHNKTKARYFHFDTPDTNNTFCIGFGTPAENSKGTTHVLEHTALCGSKQFPVRDPFFHMLRRSLSTFMNAMTGADYTLYPFATTNPQDFKNLLEVYTDAVFFPLLRLEDFRQEGHRLEINHQAEEEAASADKKATFNGVVYNEMRGVVSEPGTHFMHKLMHTMLPGTHYEYVSGGYPTDILDLTHEELVSFHKRHYHPSNSITITYGDLPPSLHMPKLNSMFSNFEVAPRVDIPYLKNKDRRTAPTIVHADGPLDPMGNPSAQKRVAVSFAVPAEMNSLEDMVRINVLDTLLTSGPSSPMYKALIESKLGTRFSPMTGYTYYFSTPVVSYGVEGASSTDEGLEDKISALIKETVTEVEAKGFDKRRVASVIFQEELSRKHRSAQYGVGLCTTLCALGVVRPSINPCDFIDWLPYLKRIEAEHEKELLPLIQPMFLGNTHTSTLSVTPKENFLDGLQNEINAREARVNETLTAEDKGRIEKETKEWLERVRGPQDSNCLPSLKVSDIPRQGFQEPQPVPYHKNPEQVFTIPHPTNGLVYVHGISPFSAALIDGISSSTVDSLYPLYVSLIGNTGAGDLNFKELSIATELVSGGFTFAPLLTNRSTNRSDFTAGFSLGFYTTKQKLQEAFALLKKIVGSPLTAKSDAEVRSRVFSTASARCSRKVQSIQRSGNTFATMKAAVGMTTCSKVKEQWGGLLHCTSSSQLLERLQRSDRDGALDEIITKYEAVCNELRESMSAGTVWATCEAQDQEEVGAILNDFLKSFDSGAARTRNYVVTIPAPDWSPDAMPVAPLVAAEEQLPIDTSFVGLATPNTLSATEAGQQAVRVAAQLLRNEYLHRKVREEGGAYGSGATSNLNGETGGITMSSYRDPTPEKTVEAFGGAAAFLADTANITAQRVNEAKLRLFSTIDAPYSADNFGDAYFAYGTTDAVRQATREQLLGIEARDVIAASKYFALSKDTKVAVLKPLAKGAAEPQSS